MAEFYADCWRGVRSRLQLTVDARGAGRHRAYAAPSNLASRQDASLRIFLSVEELAIGSSHVNYPDPPFAKNLPDGDEYSFQGFQLLMDGLFPVVSVRNGRAVRISFDMYVSAGVLSSALPPENPPQVMAQPDFGHTPIWQGIEGFYDEHGARLSDVSLTSENGFDWVTVGGLAAIALFRARRRRPL